MIRLLRVRGAPQTFSTASVKIRLLLGYRYVSSRQLQTCRCPQRANRAVGGEQCYPHAAERARCGPAVTARPEKIDQTTTGSSSVGAWRSPDCAPVWGTAEGNLPLCGLVRDQTLAPRPSSRRASAALVKGCPPPLASPDRPPHVSQSVSAGIGSERYPRARGWTQIAPSRMPACALQTSQGSAV
jgi:hypothetical protein